MGQLALNKNPLAKPIFNAIQSGKIVGMDFTRASNAFDYNSTLLLTPFGNNEPRFGFNPEFRSNGQGLLVEKQSINYVPYSVGDFTGWNSASGGIVVKNTDEVEAPDGTNTAAKLTVVESTDRFENGTMSLSNANYTYSIWLRTLDSSNSISLRFISGVDALVTNEWKRFEITNTVTNNFNKVQIRADNNTSPGTFYIWGAQVEPERKSSYILTEGTVASRAAEVLSTTDVIWFTPENGFSIYLEAEFLENHDLANDLARYFEFSDGTTDERLMCYQDTNGDIRVTSRVGGVDQASVAVSPATGKNKILISFGYFGLRLAVNGSFYSSVDSDFPIIDRFYLGQSYSGSNFLNGRIFKSLMFKQAFGQTEMEVLTK